MPVTTIVRLQRGLDFFHVFGFEWDKCRVSDSTYKVIQGLKIHPGNEATSLV